VTFAAYQDRRHATFRNRHEAGSVMQTDYAGQTVVAGRLMKALRRQLDLRNVALTSSACQEVVS